MTFERNPIINLNSINYASKNGDANLQLMDNTYKSYSNRKNSGCCCGIVLVLLGLITTLLGILLIKYTVFELFMEERIRMRPGLPPYEWWVKTAVPVKCKVYIFTVTNSEAFMNGKDTKLKLKEIGPIVYREIIEQRDIVFHENSTMSYTIQRSVEYIPEENKPGILNRTILIPNIVLLGMAAVLHDSSFTLKLGFRVISRNDPVFMNTTIYNYLWNLTSPALISADRIVPFMVPQSNGGVLYTIYKNFTDRVNVRIGAKYGYEQFFMINKFNGRPTVPGYIPEKGDCFATLVNSTEGSLYPNYLTKDSILWFWRKTVCRPVPLYFEKEIQKGSISAYKYIARESMYDRKENLTEDCYKNLYGQILPDGLTDVSKCYNELPVAVSTPHFYGRNGSWDDQLEGFSPSKDKHGSFTILEPTTGVPIEQKAKSQSNMVMPKLKFFGDKLEKFSERIIPMLWIEYHQERLNTAITAMLVFTVNILPVLQYIIPIVLLVLGALYLYFGIKRLRSYKQNYCKKEISKRI